MKQSALDMPSRRIAMLIDGDNAEAGLLPKFLDEASKHGTVTIRRIYGDWTNPLMAKWNDLANMHAFQTPHQLAVTVHKNATDGFLIIDAMDILHSGSVDGFCIISSDSDFISLAKRIREQGMFVMGIGNMHTQMAFQKACEVFTFTEILSGQAKKVTMLEQRLSGAPPVLPGKGGSIQANPAENQDATTIVAPADSVPAKTEEGQAPQVPDWKGTVLKAIEVTSSDEWNKLEAVAINIRKVDSSFDPRTYGKSKLLLLIRTAPSLFEVREERRDPNPPTHYIRITAP